MIAAWIGAVAIGLSLGLLGSGGSVLTVPVLVYLVGQDEKVAIAGSLAVVGSIALVGALPYLARGMIDWRSLGLFGIPGMIGTWLGAYVAGFVSGETQLLVFAMVMLLAAGLMLRTQPVVNRMPVQRHAWKVVIDGIVVGVLTGFVGVGGGFLIVPALVLLGGLGMHRAVATSLAIIALKSFAGFWKYLDVLDDQGLELDWGVLATVTFLGIIGSLAGNRLAVRLPHARLKRGFGVFLVFMGVFIIWRNLPVLVG
ncbi:MAG: sulfite exporter TauE/SafE family protein [Gammaproteobacteria bacterium]|nr:MAG: sulfite exporter TauE/SafE family protein [Gammaproteobacteria bacterium]